MIKKLPYRIRVRLHNVIYRIVFPFVVMTLTAILTSIVTKSVIENNAQCKQNMEDIADKLHEYLESKSLIEKI
jgi:hypothetical protein